MTYGVIMGEYYERILDGILQEYLEYVGAVLIEGTKWCGKTSTAKRLASSKLLIQDPDEKDKILATAMIKPSLLLDGDTPRLLDEWQLAPNLWDAVRYEVDARQAPGQFILTGSASPSDDATRHSGTGRISRVLMRPMSLYESKESNGKVSLEGLFGSLDNIGCKSDLSIERLAITLVRGGWPGLIGIPDRGIHIRMRDHLNSIVNSDVYNVDGITRNPTLIKELLRSISRNISTSASINTIWKDLRGGDNVISDRTVANYIDALRRIFIVEDLPGWSPAMRSKTALRTSHKWHFVDPSLAAAALRLTPKMLMEDFNTFGLLFESLCIRDLRIYSQALDGEVFHYRDKNDLEVDAIIRLDDGRWGAIEIKLGSSEIDVAAKNLFKLKSKIDEEKMGQPSFLMVLTGTEYGYKREDGIYVIPIACLKN